MVDSTMDVLILLVTVFFALMKERALLEISI
jgi:hypothetical protein